MEQLLVVMENQLKVRTHNIGLAIVGQTVVNPPIGKVWTLSRYDQKSLYDKNPAVTDVCHKKKFAGFWKLAMEVFGLDL